MPYMEIDSHSWMYILYPWMIIMLMYKLICVVFKTFNQDISMFFVVKLVIWIWKEWNIMNLYVFGKLNKCSVMLENIFTIVCLIKYKVHSV